MEIRIDDEYSTNQSITIYETQNISKEIEIVIQIRDRLNYMGEGKFRFNTREKINKVIDALMKMRDERWE